MHTSKNRAKKSHANSVPKRKNLKKKQNKRKVLTKALLSALKPIPPKPGSAAFVKLQLEWYKKAADSGFKDLEVFNRADGSALDLLNGPSLTNAAKQFNPEKLHYFRLWSCFLAHNAHHLEPRTRFIATRYAEGATFRQIMRAVNEHETHKNIYLDSLHRLLADLRGRVMRWNKTSSKGLDFEADID